MFKSKKSFLLLIFALVSINTAFAQINVTQFNQRNPGDSFTSVWHVFDFKNVPHTKYEFIKTESNEVVVKASSNASASGMIREVSIDPNEYPIIEWKWNVSKVVKNADVTKRSGDDYSARIYITFDLPTDSLGIKDRIIYNTASTFYPDGKIPIRAMNYIWSTNGEVGAIHSNPWTNLSQMIIIESGTKRTGQWVTETRNILEDYRKIYQTNPPRINAIAIMTDSDNTKQSGEAYYGEIIFKKK